MEWLFGIRVALIAASGIVRWIDFWIDLRELLAMAMGVAPYLYGRGGIGPGNRLG